jgi:hypothetical protein
MADTFRSRFRSTNKAIAYSLFALAASLMVSSSAMAVSRLVIQVRTELIPGVELGWVRSHFLELDDAGGSVLPKYSAMDRWMNQSESTDWGEPIGVRVAESQLLSDGYYSGHVSIYNPEGGLVLGRLVRVRLTGGLHVVTVLLLRDPLALPPLPGYLPATEVSHWTSEDVVDLGDSDNEHSKDPIQCPVNHAMHGLACDDSQCDNVRLFCRAVAGVSTQNHGWTSYFSEEAGSYQGCSSNEFATGLQCKGQFCDEIRLRCTEHNAVEDFCYVTDPISNDSPFTEFADPANGYVRRILCEGSFCEDKRLEICRIVGYPLSFGAFSNLCVTSVAGVMTVGTCLSAENETNISQVWHLDAPTGLISNPLNGSCLTALGGFGSLTEEPCVEAGDTSWFMDSNGRLSSVDLNNNPLCMSVVGVQDPLGLPPIGSSLELSTCSLALYQVFEPSNAALPPPLPEYDAGEGEVTPFPLPALSLPGLLLLIGAISHIGASWIRRR